MHSQDSPEELAEESLDERFFRSGDDGSFADEAPSLAPVAVTPTEAFALTEAVPQGPARRARLLRGVAWTVAALGVFAALAPLAQQRRARAEVSSWLVRPAAGSSELAQRDASEPSAALSSLSQLPMPLVAPPSLTTPVAPLTTTPVAAPATPVAAPTTPVAAPATPVAAPATPVAAPTTPVAPLTTTPVTTRVATGLARKVSRLPSSRIEPVRPRELPAKAVTVRPVARPIVSAGSAPAPSVARFPDPA